MCAQHICIFFFETSSNKLSPGNDAVSRESLLQAQSAFYFKVVTLITSKPLRAGFTIHLIGSDLHIKGCRDISCSLGHCYVMRLYALDFALSPRDRTTRERRLSEIAKMIP